MAESNKDQERNEQATPKRREEARKKGQVAKSQEVASVTILLSCLIYFYFDAGGMLERTLNMIRRSIREAGTTSVDAGIIQAIFGKVAYEAFIIMLPMFLVVIVAGLIANYSQVGFLFSTEVIKPKISKIDPVKGFQRLFSARALAELIKNILKVCVIGSVAYYTVKAELEGTLSLTGQSVWGITAYIGGMTFKIMLRTCWVLIILAILDYIFQLRQYEKGLRMSKQEIKDEHKEMEGEPLIKARIRRLQREMARRRMMANVPKADVVITNPDHIAVALKYDSLRMEAPLVLAKGKGLIAAKIREIARKSGVPIVENKPLARILFKLVDIGEAIPENLYRAVAEILAYVYGLSGQKKTL